MPGLMVASAFSTDCCRESPPSTTCTGFCGTLIMDQAARPIHIFGAKSDHDFTTDGQCRNLRMVWIRMGAPSSSMNCLRLVPDFSRPMRVPKPAAGRMTETFMRTTIVRESPPLQAGTGLSTFSGHHRLKPVLHLLRSF